LIFNSQEVIFCFRLSVTLPVGLPRLNIIGRKED
jgi:hypothetical protein